ncbi:TPA: acyltransferase family protein [Enterobacter cloacae]
MTRRDNCFDIIRHIAAYTVLVSHHFRLSGFDEPIFARWNTYGALAVAIFFCLSGYLMPKSFQSSENFMEFMKKRCLRIFPGLIFCSFVLYFLIAVIFNTANPVEYLISSKPLIHTLRNILFIRDSVDGVFTSYIFPKEIDGSLWTLPIEFACYVIIGFALSISFSWVTPALLLVAGIVSGIFFSFYPDSATYYSIPFKWLAFFSIPFSFGALLYMTSNAWMKYKKWMLGIAIAFIFAKIGEPQVTTIIPLCVTTIIIVLGLSFKDRVINGGFDISYGVYIYAFPVQQIIINNTNLNFYVSMATCALITTILAMLSYRYIERPFLHKKKVDAMLEKPVTS